MRSLVILLGLLRVQSLGQLALLLSGMELILQRTDLPEIVHT